MSPKSTYQSVFVADTTLRDGEQSPGCHLTPEQKVEIATKLAEAKVDMVEAGFPVSSPAEFGAVQTIASTVGRERDAPVIAAFGRCVERDIDACAQAISKANRPRIHVFLASSDIHLEYKLKMSRQQALDQGVAAVRYAKRFVDDVQYTPEDAFRADRVYLRELVTALIQAGVTTVNVADTVGYATPAEFATLVASLKTVPGSSTVRWSVHCHDDLGMAVANTLAAVNVGVDQVEGTINGIGERAGNCSLEEVVMALKTRADFFGRSTRVDTTKIWGLSQLVSKSTGMVVQPNKAVVGANAFSHASGIHQDGMLKNRSTYEIMRAEDIGAPATTLPLTNRSGRRALEDRIKSMGLSVSTEKMASFFDRFKRYADGRKQVEDTELRGLLEA